MYIPMGMTAVRDEIEWLYANSPKLTPAYISDVLNLHDERADRVAEITGGISRAETEMLSEVVAEIAPTTTLEIGLGYGFSAMAMCAHARPGPERRHIVIDPHQHRYWNGQGLRHLEDAGFGSCLEFHEAPSYRVLPELERQNTTVDLAFIDGWHTFDFVFVDFFYVDKMLRSGGVVAFDDADWPSIRPILRYIVTNLPYHMLRGMPEKREREPIDERLGLAGSCIALVKEQDGPVAGDLLP